MPKVILLGSQQTQWNIGNRFLPGGTLVELSDLELQKHADVVLKHEEIVPKPVEPEQILPLNPKGPYTEDELFALNKAQQIEILKELGITKIPSKEADRVKAILNARLA